MIKVRAGQTWLDRVSNEEVTAQSMPSNGLIWWSDGFQCKQGWVDSNMTFVPQNDLEWLAVNEREWKTHPHNRDFFKFIRRCEIHGVMYHNVSNDAFYWWSRKEWQNMRYHLGLDKKPHCRLIKGEWVKQ